MKKFLLLLPFFLFTSCDEDTIDDIPPSSFDVSVDDITSCSALVIWSEVLTTGEEEVKYAVYIDDILVVDNLDVYEYQMVDLDNLTYYNVKIVGSNEYGETESSTTFTTTEPRILKLSKQLYEGYHGSIQNISFFYDEDKLSQIINTEWFTLNYTYNDDNHIISEAIEDAGTFWDSILREYDGDNIETINTAYGVGDPMWYSEYTFTSETSYLRHDRHVEWDTINTYYECESVFDTENRIIQLTTVNTETLEEFTYLFEYTDGNLTKITRPDISIWTIEYDNYKSFQTYSTGYVNARYVYNTVLFFLTWEDEDLKKIPALFQNNNTNNPTVFKKNGIVQRTVNYEYNADNYPSKSVDDDGENIFYEYYE